MSKILDNIVETFKELTISDEFTAFITKPITDGKCYHIGDISELLDVTEKISSEDINILIHERAIDIHEDFFTIQYIFDYRSDPNDDDEGDVIILGHKVSPGFLFVTGFIVHGTKVSLNPCFAIIPLEKPPLDTTKPGYILELFNTMMSDGVHMSFIGFLDSVQHAFSFGDITFFYVGPEDPHKDKDIIEEVANSMKDLVIDAMYRFFILKEQGKEIKVSPNTDFSPKGYVRIRDRSTSYHILKAPANDEYLGFTKRTPDD